MDQCFYCHWYNKKHAEKCPEMADAAQKEAAFATWEKGYNDGRHRHEPQSEDPTYSIGWVRGDAKADYSDNVFE